MYRTDLDTRHKSGAVTAVIAIHVALAMAFLHLSGTVDLTDPESALRVFDVTEVEPPAPEPPPPPGPLPPRPLPVPVPTPPAPVPGPRTSDAPCVGAAP